MAFDRQSLLSHQFTESRQVYSARDTMLYGLGLGLGSDPTDERQLRFIYEKNLEALPSMGVVLAHPGFWTGDPALGIDSVRMLHVGQGLTVHRPIPIAGAVIGRSRIVDVIDRGAGKGALLYYERVVHDAQTDEPIVTVRQTLLCRGNGGFEAPTSEPAEPHRTPEREPDHVVSMPTLPQAALIYRLSGDMNPLHADPQVARQAGFARPILHGLATYGLASYALMEAAGGDPTMFEDFDIRFTSPVFPGETVTTHLWIEGDVVSVRAFVAERNAVVLDNGRARTRARRPARQVSEKELSR